ncbi:MAG: CRISPR-associated helicase Cas3' [Armatimonadota bacterium]
MAVYVAHTPNPGGNWHSLSEHLREVARLAREFGAPIGVGELAYWAGLWHDLGKYTPEFQQYLRACHTAALTGSTPPPRGDAPHKQFGAALAVHYGASLLGFAILGHHGGLPERAELKREAAERSLPSLAELLETAGADLPELKMRPDLAAELRRLAADPREADFLIRMVYSCLVDADSLDTEAHTRPEVAAARQAPRLGLHEMRDRLHEDQAHLQAQAAVTPLNALRRQIYEACAAAAAGAPGVYRLTVPTGGGKTRSSLAFALEHAVEHGLRGVIYAIPYTSIVEQTVGEFEKILGEEAVLEHHSAVEPDARSKREEWLRRLECQNWDAPLVVTTTVQLFESLFGNRPARSRKVHRMARSVIVLDEVQALPPKLLRPLVDGLRLLCDRYGSTVLLCTATQPVLGCDVLAEAGFPDIPEIAPDPPQLFRKLQRVEFDLSPLAEGEWTWERVGAAMRETDQCLAVLNTRRDALALLDAVKDLQPLHLSTLLCGRHRRDTLEEIRRRLRQGEPCYVASTQVVECGCDLDFPRVLRALGPLDRIVQAAGRCNREGLRPRDESRVLVFRPEGGGAPRGSYAVALSVADRLLRGDANLHDPALYERYFREAFLQDDTDARGVQKSRKELDFPAVAEKVRLIPEETVGILVRYKPAEAEIEALLEEIRDWRQMTSELWRRVQPFLVSVSAHEFDRFRNQALVHEEVPDLWLWLGSYDPVRGLTDAQRDPADLII